MSCDHTRAVLAGEAAHVDVSQHLQRCPSCSTYADELLAIDHLFAQLPPPSLPEGLAEQVLDIVDDAMSADEPEAGPDVDALFAQLPPPSLPEGLAEQVLSTVDAASRPRRRRRSVIGGGLVAAAAALLVIAQPGSEPAELERLREKGDGVSLPAVDLKVAVLRDGNLERYRADAAYTVGDVLYFRAQSDRPTTAVLLRVAGGAVEQVHAQPLSGSGAEDLRLGEHPLAWTIEPGEDSASFVLLAGDLDGASGPLEGVFGMSDGGCGAVSATLDISCTHIDVEVTP